MRKTYFIIAVILFTSCANRVNNTTEKTPCVIDFKYLIPDSANPNVLLSFITDIGEDLMKMLFPAVNYDPVLFHEYVFLSFFKDYNMEFKFSGGIYNYADSIDYVGLVDYVSIHGINDSTLFLSQNIVFLEKPEPFVDSLINITKKELVVEITNKLSGEKWIIPNCNCRLTTPVDWWEIKKNDDYRRRAEYEKRTGLKYYGIEYE